MFWFKNIEKFIAWMKYQFDFWGNISFYAIKNIENFKFGFYYNEQDKSFYNFKFKKIGFLILHCGENKIFFCSEDLYQYLNAKALLLSKPIYHSNQPCMMCKNGKIIFLENLEWTEKYKI